MAFYNSYNDSHIIIPTMQNQLNNLERSVGRIEGKLDSVIKHLEKINGSIDRHDDQIGILKTEYSKVKGATAGIAIAVSTIFTIVVYVTSYFIR